MKVMLRKMSENYLTEAQSTYTTLFFLLRTEIVAFLRMEPDANKSQSSFFIKIILCNQG